MALVKRVPFGPGTLTYTVGTDEPVNFAQEVKGGGITHTYSDVGESTVYLDNSSEGAGATRVDALKATCDFGLGAEDYYNFLFTHDLELAQVVYVPNTEAEASWSGTVQLRLPDGAQAEKVGAKLTGTIEHKFEGPCEFTPTPATP